MAENNKYEIACKDLKAGLYNYTMHVDSSVFEDIEDCEIKNAQCEALIEMTYSVSKADLKVKISGEVTVECDRCLELCNIPISFEDSLNVIFGEDEQYDGETLSLRVGCPIDLKQYLYESLILALPLRRVHEDGKCNPEMLARFFQEKE